MARVLCVKEICVKMVNEFMAGALLSELSRRYLPEPNLIETEDDDEWQKVDWHNLQNTTFMNREELNKSLDKLAERGIISITMLPYDEAMTRYVKFNLFMFLSLWNREAK